MSPFPNNTSSRSLPGSVRFRVALHFGMGLLYLILAVVVIRVRHFGQIELQPAAAYGLGALLIVYGLFRMWRGWADVKAARRGEDRNAY